MLFNKLENSSIVETLNRYSELDRNFSLNKFETNIIE